MDADAAARAVLDNPSRGAIMVQLAIERDAGSVPAGNVVSAIYVQVASYEYDVAAKVLEMFTDVRSLAPGHVIVDLIRNGNDAFLALVFAKLALMRLYDPPVFTQEELRRVMINGVEKAARKSESQKSDPYRERDPKDIWNDMDDASIFGLHALIVRCDPVDAIIDSFGDRAFASSVAASMCQDGDSHILLRLVLSDEPERLDAICRIVRRMYPREATRIIAMLGLAESTAVATTVTTGAATTETSVTGAVATTVVTTRACHTTTETDADGLTFVDAVGQSTTTIEVHRNPTTGPTPTPGPTPNPDPIIATITACDSETVVDHEGASTSARGDVSIATNATVASCRGDATTRVSTTASGTIVTRVETRVASAHAATVTVTITERST